MPDFSHLKALDITGAATAELTLYELEGEPVLTLAPAGEANKPYFNALLKRTGKNLKRVQGGGLNAAMVAENRDEDRELFPQHVIKGWRGVKDSSGAEVEFTRENCAEWVRQLPSWLFDRVRDFAGTTANFVPDVVDGEGLGKN